MPSRKSRGIMLGMLGKSFGFLPIRKLFSSICNSRHLVFRSFVAVACIHSSTMYFDSIHAKELSSHFPS